MGRVSSFTRGRMRIMVCFTLLWLSMAGRVLAADQQEAAVSQKQEMAAGQAEDDAVDQQWDETMEEYLNELD